MMVLHNNRKKEEINPKSWIMFFAWRNESTTRRRGGEESAAKIHPNEDSEKMAPKQGGQRAILNFTPGGQG
jgi:hypothetical protein